MTGVLPVVRRMKLQIHLNKEVYWSVLEFIWMKRFTEAACPRWCKLSGQKAVVLHSGFEVEFVKLTTCPEHPTLFVQLYWFFSAACNFSLLADFIYVLYQLTRWYLLTQFKIFDTLLRHFCKKLVHVTKFVCAFCKSSWKCDLPSMLLPPLSLLLLLNCAQCWKRVPDASRYSSVVSIV
jgi:hypothetical protein